MNYFFRLMEKIYEYGSRFVKIDPLLADWTNEDVFRLLSNGNLIDEKG